MLWNFWCCLLFIVDLIKVREFLLESFLLVRCISLLLIFVFIGNWFEINKLDVFLLIIICKKWFKGKDILSNFVSY